MGKRILLLVVVLCAATLQMVAGDCNVCGTKSHVACTSQTEFDFCFDGIQNKNFSMKCPPGTYCTDTSGICGTGSPTCVSSCGRCSLDSRFACVTETSFTLCYGTSKPHPGVITSCPEGYICSLNAAGICTPRDKNTKPTCNPGEEASIPRSGFSFSRF